MKFAAPNCCRLIRNERSGVPLGFHHVLIARSLGRIGGNAVDHADVTRETRDIPGTGRSPKEMRLERAGKRLSTVAAARERVTDGDAVGA